MPMSITLPNFVDVVITTNFYVCRYNIKPDDTLLLDFNTDDVIELSLDSRHHAIVIISDGTLVFLA